jgi:hypothetical protein
LEALLAIDSADTSTFPYAILIIQFPTCPPFKAVFALVASSTFKKFMNAHSLSGIMRIDSIGPYDSKIATNSSRAIFESKWPTHKERVGVDSDSSAADFWVAEFIL